MVICNTAGSLRRHTVLRREDPFLNKNSVQFERTDNVAYELAFILFIWFFICMVTFQGFTVYSVNLKDEINNIFKIHFNV